MLLLSNNNDIQANPPQKKTLFHFVANIFQVCQTGNVAHKLVNLNKIFMPCPPTPTPKKKPNPNFYPKCNQNISKIINQIPLRHKTSIPAM